MEATKTIYQDDLVTAQGVKTLGRRNAKPTAYREVVEEYIQQVNTAVDDERHQSRTKQERYRGWRYREDSRLM
jgi:hypothetical protein